MIKLDFTTKTAIITGATQGIGEGIADSLWELGCNIVVTGLEVDPPERIIKKTRFNYHQLDFLDRESLNKFLDYIKGLSNVDILVNNAGINILQPIDNINEADWDKVLKVNLYGPMLTMREVALKMKIRKEGRIVNISSISGLVPKPGSNAYSASKAGLMGLTRASALDLAPFNILVNALCPGTTQTDMVKRLLTEEREKALKMSVPMQRFARVEEIANFAVFLSSDLNTYITGQTIIIDGGFSIQ